MIKGLQEWHEMSIDCVILALYYLQGYHLTEFFCGQNGLGIYNVLSRYKHSIIPVPQSLGKFYPPEEIVLRIKGKFNESYQQYADQQMNLLYKLYSTGKPALGNSLKMTK